jgi:hypothetical protein
MAKVRAANSPEEWLAIFEAASQQPGDEITDEWRWKRHLLRGRLLSKIPGSVKVVIEPSADYKPKLKLNPCSVTNICHFSLSNLIPLNQAVLDTGAEAA